MTTLTLTPRALGLTAGLLCTLFAPSASAQDAEAVARGEAKYTHTCAPCHGRGLGGDGPDGREALPGTAALEIKYQGALPAALEDRSGLSYEVLKPFVRNGSWSMPPFRPTELSDDEIRDIAAYLEASSDAVASSREGP